jgi:hypothetical protein
MEESMAKQVESEAGWMSQGGMSSSGRKKGKRWRRRRGVGPSSMGVFPLSHLAAEKAV